MDYKHEYGRYRKKYEEQVEEIVKLKEDIEGWKQLLDVNTAIIAAIVHSAGGELTLPRITVNEAAQQKLVVASHLDEEEKNYVLTVSE